MRCCAGCATRRRTSGSRRAAARLEAGLAPFGTVQRVGSMLTLFDRPVRTTTTRARATPSATRALFRHLLERGIYVAPSQFEAMFVSLAHTDEDVDARWRRSVTSSAN